MGGTSFYKKTAAVSIFLTFNERQSKTRQRVNPRDIRVVKPKMWENLEVPDLCPIKMYKFHKEKDPLISAIPMIRFIWQLTLNNARWHMKTNGLKDSP